MAPPTDSDAQFKFLIACIKHSTAGKIDFDEVARECDIVSKGAAAKRYERLMKAHGIPSNNGAQAGPAPSGPSTPTTPAGSKSTPKGRASSAKKRKLAALGDDLDEDDKGKAKTQIKEAKHEASNDGSNDENLF